MRSQVASYYEKKLQTHGATPSGVDWNGELSQTLRFTQLCQLLPADQSFSVLDFGCGYGALYDYLSVRRNDFEYTGFDISQEMLAAARARAPNSAPPPEWLNSTSNVPNHRFDFAVASGVFNVRLDTSEEDWKGYIVANLEELNRLTLRGFSFNCLTWYSDEDRKRDDLYYGKPEVFFELCKTRFSRNVALLHDYDLYEFTMIVRKQ